MKLTCGAVRTESDAARSPTCG